MQLGIWQQQFFAALLEPHLDSPIYQDNLAGVAESRRRMRIYHDSMQATLGKVLAKIYPACQKLVGEEFFTQLSQAYVQRYHSLSPNLNHYGLAFAPFVKTYPGLEALPYAAELARLEWMWHQVFYGADNSLSSPEAMAESIAQQGENIHLKLPEDAQLFNANYAVDRLWYACQPEYQGAYDFAIEETVHLLVYQQLGRIYLKRLNPAEAQFAACLMKYPSLVVACEHYQALNLPETPAEIMHRLSQQNLIYV